MNLKTRSIGHYDDWYYETKTGEVFNAVDTGEVVPVMWSPVWDDWVEVDVLMYKQKIRELTSEVKLYSKVIDEIEAHFLTRCVRLSQKCTRRFKYKISDIWRRCLYCWLRNGNQTNIRQRKQNRRLASKTP